MFKKENYGLWIIIKTKCTIFVFAKFNFDCVLNLGADNLYRSPIEFLLSLISIQ